MIRWNVILRNFFILLGLSGPSFAQSFTLSLPLQAVPSTATFIDVPVLISGTAPLGAIQFSFSYDESQLAYVGPVLTGSLMAGRNMIFNGAVPGEVRAGFAAASPISLASGVLCYVRFSRVLPLTLSHLIWNRNPNTTFILLGSGAPVLSLQTTPGVLYPQGVGTTLGSTNGDQTVCELDTARLSITGSNATQYQWYFSTDSTATEFLPVNAANYQAGPFSGAQSPELVLANVLQMQQSGIYFYCRLSSGQGTILSQAQELTIRLNNFLSGSEIQSVPPLPLCTGSSVQFRLSTSLPVSQGRWFWTLDGFPVGNDSVLNLQNINAGQVIGCELRGANCTYANDDLTIITSSAPLTFTTTGGGTTCSRGPALSIGIAGSESNTRYVLLRNGISTGDTIIGSGLARVFPSQLLVGTYKVLALSPLGCQLVFPDSALIVHYPQIPKTISPNTMIVAGNSTMLSASGGLSSQSYNWFPTTGLSSSQGMSVVAAPQQTTLYSVSIEDFFGCRDTLTVLVTVVATQPSGVFFSVRCFLEGLYTGSGQMRPALYQLGLSSQLDAADSLEIGFWNPASLSVPIWRDTLVLNTSGLANVELPNLFRGSNLYISVRNRNSLETWSATPVMIQDSLIYDFTNSFSSAYSNGNNVPLKLLPGGRLALYGGDINSDGAIDITDLSAVWTATFGSPAPAYVATDLTGDGIPDIADISLVWANTFNSLYYARP
jgi:hypothetical protein